MVVLPCLPMVVRVLFPRCRRMAWSCLRAARLFVAVCDGNVSLLAIGCYRLRLCSFCVSVFVCEGVC